MVSADNLNLDCLELIFAYLSGNDLVSVSLVSRSFLAGVIPRLYRTLSFGLNQAKRYPSIISPFAAVLAHTNLANHVRHIDLRAIPKVKLLPQPKFMNDCTRTIALCKNLGSFTCTLDMMPSFLLALQEKESLEQIRFVGNLTPDQAALIVKVSGLRSLTLDSGSWSIVDVLPRWSSTLRPSLTSLTLSSVQPLSMDIMDTVLRNLPSLTTLHIVNCPKIDQSSIFRLVSHTPQLQSLAFTSHSQDTARPIPTAVTPLPRLRHLAIDSQFSPTTGDSTPNLWTTIINLTRIWSCPLKSLSLKLSDKITLSDSFITNVVSTHHATLAHLSLRNCVLTRESLMSVCRNCTELETFKLSMPARDIFGQSGLPDALSFAKRLHTLTDVGDLHTTHNQRAPILKSEIHTLMARQPTLEKVIADGRTWTAVRYPGQTTQVELQVKKNGPSLRHWFLPPPGVIQH